jgi:opine dehydrogenase
MTKKTRYAVIGAGHGGKAMAAHLAQMGFPTTLYNRTPDRIAAIKELQGIDLEGSEGGPRGFCKLECVTSSIAEALATAEMIMVVVPSSAHADVAKACAPHLKDGQIVVLHPGRTCGAIEFAKVLRDQNCQADVSVAEAETFIYASRSDGPAQARIFRIKEAVPLAALPATRTRLVLDKIHEAYPQFIDGGNVLQTGLNNMGAIFHPALAMLNSGWIESTHGDYQFYIDGVNVLQWLLHWASVGVRLSSGSNLPMTLPAKIFMRLFTTSLVTMESRRHPPLTIAIFLKTFQ